MLPVGQRRVHVRGLREEEVSVSRDDRGIAIRTAAATLYLAEHEIVAAMDFLVRGSLPSGRGLRTRVIEGHILTSWKAVRAYVENFAEKQARKK